MSSTVEPYQCRGGLNATESFSSLVLILNLLIDVYTKQSLRMQLFDARPNLQYISNTHSFEGNKKCGQIVLFVHCGSLQKIHIDIYVLMSLGPAIHKGRPH